MDGAARHPLQQLAKTDSERIGRTALVDATWSDSKFDLVYSSGCCLRVSASEPAVEWEVVESHDNLSNDIELPRTLGSPPMMFCWPRIAGVRLMDCSELIEKRLGAEFTRLFVNEMGLWVYFRTHLILGFSAVRRTDTGECLLHVWEDE